VFTQSYALRCGLPPHACSIVSVVMLAGGLKRASEQQAAKMLLLLLRLQRALLLWIAIHSRCIWRQSHV